MNSILIVYFRIYIVEQYKEFYSRDICTSDPMACKWLKQRFRDNNDYIKSMVKLYANQDPYWHQVNLLYKQMDGISEGKCSQ